MVANYQQIPVIHVQKNDTLYSLAKRYDTTAEELAKHNGIDDPTELQPGTSLNVPRGSTPVQTSSSGGNTGTKKIVQTGKSANTSKKADGKTSVQSNKTKTAAKKTPVKSAKAPLSPAKPAVSKGVTAKTASKTTLKSPAKSVSVQQTPETKKLKKPFVATGKVNFAWPLKGKIISNYGGKGHGVKNDGINIAAQKGATVKAAESGIVVYAGNELKGYGNLILLKHEKNFMTAYAHADTLCVDDGDVVDKGQKIATVGQTGNVKSPQLHFEVRYRTKAVDPKKHLH